MTAWQRIPFVGIALSFAVLAPRARAATKLDLERTTPVPATEPIPVQDFFRPPVFSGPKLNSSGTHFAALVDTKDHTCMLICDMVKARSTIVNGTKSKDIDSISWLDDTHVLSSLLSDKLYAEGLFITDVTDSVKMMIKSGLVDPARIAIMGTSFGGYLAVCGAAFEPDLYRCAITVSGVFDWEQVLKEKKSVQYESAAYGIFLRNLGNPKTNREQFDQISPLRHIDQVKIPVFVAHGKDDNVADVSESRALISQLEKHHVSYKSMLVSNEGHGMSFTKDQVELYSRIEAFLAENLAPAKTATVASAEAPKN